MSRPFLLFAAVIRPTSVRTLARDVSLCARRLGAARNPTSYATHSQPLLSGGANLREIQLIGP